MVQASCLLQDKLTGNSASTTLLNNSQPSNFGFEMLKKIEITLKRLPNGSINFQQSIVSDFLKLEKSSKDKELIKTAFSNQEINESLIRTLWNEYAGRSALNLAKHPIRKKILSFMGNYLQRSVPEEVNKGIDFFEKLIEDLKSTLKKLDQDKSWDSSDWSFCLLPIPKEYQKLLRQMTIKKIEFRHYDDLVKKLSEEYGEANLRQAIEEIHKST